MKELRKIIASFPETKDLKLEDHQLITVYQYIKEKKAFNPNDETNKYEPVLRFDPIRVDYVFAKAYQEALEAEEKQKLIDHRDYGDYLIDASLSNFRRFNDEREKAYQKAKTFINKVINKEYTKGLYLFGKNRTGKTYLLSAIANELAKSNIETIFAYTPDLIRSIHGAIKDNTIEMRVKELKYTNLLIIDDIGSAIMSLWFRDQIFGPVISHRLAMGLPMLFSSNMTINSLSKHLIDPNQTDDKFHAVRIVTRIAEMIEPVELSSDSFKAIDRKS
ncbi:MAG: ATP-binding protein [Acholeplasmataceae bacterium]|jgi:primosomal protein DnaI|nr:ATP-binding protein [Acholeplasmataceae bacterium]HHT39567.1 ATP-binding protein [Acholeplasmataceae bacterium]